MRKVKIYHVRQIILTKNFLRIICNKRCDTKSNLRQIGFLASNVRLYFKFFIAVFPWIVLSRSTMSFFCSYGKRTGVICGFGGMQLKIQTNLQWKAGCQSCINVNAAAITTLLFLAEILHHC